MSGLGFLICIIRSVLTRRIDWYHFRGHLSSFKVEKEDSRAEILQKKLQKNQTQWYLLIWLWNLMAVIALGSTYWLSHMACPARALFRRNLTPNDPMIWPILIKVKTGGHVIHHWNQLDEQIPMVPWTRHLGSFEFKQWPYRGQFWK